MDRTLIDTDIFIKFLRKNPLAVSKFDQYLLQYGQLTFSIITRYEILRGYEITTAVQKIEKFNQLCAVSEVLPLRDRIIVKAAKIYADLESKGERIGDPDCLIAATALINGLSVCTNNERHFMRIDGLNVVNWLN